MARAAVLDPTTSRTEVVDLPEPELADHDVRIEVAAAGVNFWEIMQRHGRVPIGQPAVPGSEGAGVVVEVGAAVSHHRVGDRVAWSKVPGSYTERLVAPAASFFPVADSLDDETAAGLLFQGVTAHYLSTDTWPLGEGDLAVVTAASGGVGLLLTQMLVNRGASVVGLVSSETKTAAALEAGAQTVVTYGERPAERLREAGVGDVAAVFDSVGGSVARSLLGTLRPRGAMVLYGAASGEEAGISSADLGAGSYFVTRTAGRDYSRTPEEVAARAESVLADAAAGRLRVRVGGTWPLTETDIAWDALESRETTGKLLLRT